MAGLAGAGIGVAGVGILPRIFVWMIEVHEGIQAEIIIKNEINKLLKRVLKPIEEKDALTKKYKLKTTYRSHVGAFLLNILTTLWSYFITIMAVLGPDKVSKQADSESTYNQVRKGVITGGPMIEGILAGLVLHFQTRSVKWQAKLEQQQEKQTGSTTTILQGLDSVNDSIAQSKSQSQAEEQPKLKVTFNEQKAEDKGQLAQEEQDAKNNSTLPPPSL